MYITILVKTVYLFISQVSGERLQDHWSSGYVFPMTPPGWGLYGPQGHGWQDL